MLAEYHDAGELDTASGARIRIRLPLRPRAPRYQCPTCGAQVTGDNIVEHPGTYPVQCLGCGAVTRAVVLLPFFMVLS